MTTIRPNTPKQHTPFSSWMILLLIVATLAFSYADLKTLDISWKGIHMSR